MPTSCRLIHLVFKSHQWWNISPSRLAKLLQIPDNEILEFELLGLIKHRWYDNELVDVPTKQAYIKLKSSKYRYFLSLKKFCVLKNFEIIIK